MATTPVPSPLAVDGVVFNDVDTRTLFVRLGDAVGGHGQSLWRQGWSQLVAAQSSGFRSRVPDVWAHGAGKRDIAHGQPAEGGALKFYFAPANDAYSALVGRPGLAAIVVLDRSACTILHVKFVNRP